MKFTETRFETATQFREEFFRDFVCAENPFRVISRLFGLARSASLRLAPHSLYPYNVAEYTTILSILECRYVLNCLNTDGTLEIPVITKDQNSFYLLSAPNGSHCLAACRYGSSDSAVLTMFPLHDLQDVEVETVTIGNLCDSLAITADELYY